MSERGNVPSAAAWQAYDRAVETLEALSRHPIDNTPPLSARRLRRLLDLRGNPQQSMQCVVVVGTCGKGSTAAMLAAILREAGYRVGLFTGPHLIHYTERIQVNGANIGVRDFAERVEQALELVGSVTQLSDGQQRPSVLEVLALVAMEYFCAQRVDWAVIEAGLGGARDCSGALNPQVCVLTTIDLDHTHVLGRTVGEIAQEKSGAVRDGVPVVSTVMHDEARDQVRRRCHERGAPCWLVNRDFAVDSIHVEAGATTMNFFLPDEHLHLKEVRLGLIGGHQALNAGAAVAAALRLRRDGLIGVDEAAVRRALLRARFPGRMEWFAVTPPILLDGAHQPAGAAALAHALEQIYAGWDITLMLGILADKDRAGMAAALGPLANRVVVAPPPWESRAADTEGLVELMQQHVPPGTSVAAAPDHVTALDQARAAASEAHGRSLVCVTGSLYLVGAVRSLLVPGDVTQEARRR